MRWQLWHAGAHWIFMYPSFAPHSPTQCWWNKNCQMFLLVHKVLFGTTPSYQWRPKRSIAHFDWGKNLGIHWKDSRLAHFLCSRWWMPHYPESWLVGHPPPFVALQTWPIQLIKRLGPSYEHCLGHYLLLSPHFLPSPSPPASCFASGFLRTLYSFWGNSWSCLIKNVGRNPKKVSIRC